MVRHDVPCLNSKRYAEAMCYYQSGFYFSCRESCTLSSISFSGTIIDALFSLIDNAIHGRNINDFANYPVVQAINAGLEQNPSLMPSGNGNYQAYYNIYADEYNHDHHKGFEVTGKRILDNIDEFIIKSIYILLIKKVLIIKLVIFNGLLLFDTT